MASKAEQRRARLIEICLALPEASHRGGQHSKFEVRGRTFAYYLFDHHGDGKAALSVKAPPGEPSRLITADAERYFSPSYLGPKGWVALRIDTPRVDWEEIEMLVYESYRLTAPKSLARTV